MLSTDVILIFASVTYVLPQIKGEAPEEEEVAVGALTMDSFIAMGEKLYHGKGTCALCHNNLGCALINCLDQGGVPPQICFLVAMAFAFALSILVTNRIEAPMTRALRGAWNRYRSPQDKDAAVSAVAS